jgi:hypothetical protein
MKVVYITDGKYPELTLGKEYNVKKIITDIERDIDNKYEIYTYLSICNNGINILYDGKYFITLEEYRNKRLEEIGI